MFLDDVPVHHLAVWLAALLYLIIGATWYASFLFGHCRTTQDKALPHHEKPPGEVSCPLLPYLGEGVIALITAYVLALFIQLSQADEIAEGISVAIWVWIGFIVTTQFSPVLWGKRSMKQFFVHAGFLLVVFMAMGALIMYVNESLYP